MQRDQQELRHWLTLVRAPGVGPATFQRLWQRFSSLDAIFSASLSELQRAGLSAEAASFVRRADAEPIEQDLRWLEQPTAHLVTWGSAVYPTLLADIADPPPALFVLGDVGVLCQPQLAIVGSRNPTEPGRETARAFAAHLASAGLVVTSGMALGIDAAAHEGALSARLPTIAVTGTGLDRVYPARHRELAHRIGSVGALVSEFPTGVGPLAANFPRRNRIISGLSLGTLVVEAAPQSGSLITARLASEQGREVFAIPGSIHNPLARGCNALIRQGAKLVESAADIIEELGPISGVERKPAQLVAGGVVEEFSLDADHARVLECLGHEPTAVDTVVARSGLTPEAVCSMLLVLELHGHVTSAAGGHYCRAGKRA
ncbi:MAG: hypothetical protein AMS22_00515 [Thiotrichales bacterium SG8_50]|nr:MAG: hypothetical protein AMS22_00515 [Thiotrichales bacterium SG8_50]